MIDGLHLTTRRPRWRYNTKEYIISCIVGPSQRGWVTLSTASRKIDCKPRIRGYLRTKIDEKYELKRGPENKKDSDGKRINCWAGYGLEIPCV